MDQQFFDPAQGSQGNPMPHDDGGQQSQPMNTGDGSMPQGSQGGQQQFQDQQASQQGGQFGDQSQQQTVQYNDQPQAAQFNDASQESQFNDGIQQNTMQSSGANPMGQGMGDQSAQQGDQAAGAGTPPPPPPPPPPSDDSQQDTAAPDVGDYQFGAVAAKLDINIKIPAHNLQFDESYFLRLLAGSISLTIEEKKKIIDSIPRLSQYQIDELIKILEEEKRKFLELNKKHLAQLKKLEEKHTKDWEDLEVRVQEESQAGEDEQKAEDIKKQLGL